MVLKTLFNPEHRAAREKATRQAPKPTLKEIGKGKCNRFPNHSMRSQSKEGDATEPLE
jgi:hypothetical protein